MGKATQKMKKKKKSILWNHEKMKSLSADKLKEA